MKFLLLGIDKYSLIVFNTIRDLGYEICGIITHEANKVTSELKYVPKIKEFADSNNIPYFVRNNINDDESYEIIKKLEPDVIFSAHFAQILKERIINLGKIISINLHPSLLPDYKGPFPWQHILLNGEKKTGVTIHKLSAEIDGGNILYQQTMDLSDSINLHDLFKSLKGIYPEVVKKAIELIKAGKTEGYPQGKSKTEYARILTKEDYILHHSDNLNYAFNKIRALSKPDISARINNYKIKLGIIAKKYNSNNEFNIEKDGLYVKFNGGFIYCPNGYFERLTSEEINS